MADHWANAGWLPLVILAAVGYAYTFGFVAVVVWRKRPYVFATDFSARRYYSLMGWAPVAIALLALLVDARFLLFALVAALAGILGETLLGWVWSRFFEPPVFTYRYRGVLRGRTATINLLPWMIGALLFLCTGRMLGMAPVPFELSLASPLGVSLLALVASAPVAALLLATLGRTARRDRRLTGARFALFCAPIACTGLALMLLCDARYGLLMAMFAVVGTLTEYAYGRSMSLFFASPLWTYHHWPIDEGHSSPVTLPLWALAGLYFYWIAAALGLA